MTQKAYGPIPRRRLYQEVLDRLVAQISGGAYAPGDTVTADIYEHWLERCEDEQ